MPRLPLARWAEMTTTEIATLDGERTVAVLPVAAIEQHGPHLPLDVDALINRGIVARTIELLPDDLPASFLPAQEIGRSAEHIAFPGTLSADPETLRRLWVEIGESLHRSGLRKLVIFNSHGGQPEVVDLVARDLRVRRGMLVVNASWYRLGYPPLDFGEEERLHGIHGGAIETSIVMHLRPDLVRRDKLADFRSISADFAANNELLGPHRPIPFAWMTQDLNAAGACGNATLADAETGRRLVDHAAERLVTLLREVAAFDLKLLRDVPGKAP